MVDGQEMEAEKAAAIHEVREIFKVLLRCMKQISMYRHNKDRYAEYLEPAHTALADFLDRKGSLELRLEAMSFKYKGQVVFEDDRREQNMIYPFWQAGIRLFILKAGLSPEEFMRYLFLSMETTEERRRSNEDIVTRLWKEEFLYIEYVVVESFKAVDDDDIEEVEIEIEKVVAYLYRQLQSNSEDYLRFARISVEDLDLELNNVDQLRGAVVQGVTASAADKARVQGTLEQEDDRVLPKLVTVFFQLLELDTTEENFEDVAEAFVQLLDALLIAEKFSAIFAIRERFERAAQRPKLSEAKRELVSRAGERFASRMAEAQRLQMIAQILNQGVVKDPEGLRKYLYSLGPEAVPPLVDVLENLELLPNRRVICEILADLGAEQVGLFTSRLTHPSSNLVKDMLYVIDKIDPPEKFAIFAHVLKHPNAILRLETLSLIGKGETDECFAVIKEVVLNHEDPQMRGQAARSLPNFEIQHSVPVLLDAVNEARLEKMEDPEKRALFTALGQTHAKETQEYLFGILDRKGGLFGRGKADDLKMLAIIGLEANPSMPSLAKLAEVAKDPKRNSKEVAEAARAAALQMQARIMGVG
jgi:hypothetical protein